MAPMKCNVGWIDRVVRLLVGLPIAVSYLYIRHFSVGWARAALVLGVWLLITAAFRWCPLSALFGFSTLRQDNLEPLPDSGKS